MNANELALFQDDLAKEWEYEGIEAKELRESATMLRQQQTEIEALKAENSHLKYEISSGAWNIVPLTDEELSKVYEELYINYAGKDFPVDLGRAILRKASEK
jgi:predicted RNase H-like nuclease (RuvC/YqgF family)